jgi:hypothetical protein
VESSWDRLAEAAVVEGPVGELALSDCILFGGSAPRCIRPLFREPLNPTTLMGFILGGGVARPKDSFVPTHN